MVLGGILAFFMSMLLVFSVGLLTGNLFDRSGKEEQSIALTDGDYWINYVTETTGFAGGTGTASDPYLIETAEQLAYLSYMVYSGSASVIDKYYYYGVYFKQTADIDLSAHYWQPIGIEYDRNGTQTQHYFSGIYDGDGYTLSGIYTPEGSDNAYSYQGLFGYVYGRSSTNKAEIKNVGVVNFNIQGYNYVGGVVGYTGYNTTITNCYNTASVTGSEYVGGIAGYADSTITNCYNKGSVTGSGFYVGGIVGDASSSSTITNCYNTGSVTGSSIYVGGIVGYADSYSNITNCYNTGSVAGSSSYVGGIVGNVFNTMITNCYNTGVVSGRSSVGGIVGNASSSTITNCYNTGSVTGSSSSVGGIVGDVSSYSTITNCYNTGSVTGSSYVGGIAGNGSPTNCFNLGEVIGTGSGTINIDGITANGTATNCYYGGECTLEGYSETLATDARNIEWYKNIEKWSSDYVWDFYYLWDIVAGENDGLPIFAKGTDNWILDGFYDTTWEGKGTVEEPFLISTAQELAGLSYVVYYGTAEDKYINGDYYFSGVYFKQTADIDLSEHYWQPIGISDDRYGNSVQHYFSGKYDGGNFTISGINTPSGTMHAYSYQGLFGYVRGESSTNQAEIKNVGVIDSNIHGYYYVGGIVGYANYNTTITNCYNKGSVTGSSSYVGGIVGYADSYSNITNCYNTGSVAGSSSYVGGIVGNASSSTITNCYNTGAVTLNSTRIGTYFVGVGGIAGDGNATNCYNTGTVTLNSTGTGTHYVGGIAGDGNATNCFNLGEVIGTGSGTINISGITGNGTATNCYYGGDCTLEGYSETLTTDAKNIEWYKDSSNWSKNYLWDFVCVWELDEINNNGYPFFKDFDWWLADSSYYDVNWNGLGTAKDPYLIENAADLAGLSYAVYSGKVESEYVSGNYYFSGIYFKQTADIDLSAHYWQPIGIYYDRNGTWTQHYFSGIYDGGGCTISGLNTPFGRTSEYSYQGLFGYVYGQSSTNKAEIKNVGVINSNIQGYQRVGGIVGYADSSYSTITNCYNTASVTGSRSVGGIVGDAYYSTITNCYNTGTVIGSGDRVGGIVGGTNSDTTIKNCYNTGTVTLNSTGTGTHYVGGIAGDGSPTNCFNLGEVTGTGSGTINIGGITARGTATNCYYGGDCTLEGYSETLVTDAKNIGWYKDFSNWSNNGLWDFVCVWVIDAEINDGYPYLDPLDWWLSDSTYYDTTWEGKGTIEEPFLISTAQELAGLSYLVYYGEAGELYPQYVDGNYYFTGAYFKQTADIDLSAHYWQPIGIYYDRNGTTTRHYFSGVYDGNGYTISGLNTPFGTTSEYSQQGLFGYVSGESYTNQAEIKNVGVINSSIQGYQNVGGIVGDASSSSTITNCYNTGSVTGSLSSVGGIAGSSSSTITNCYNTGSVTGSDYVGGIVGDASSSSTITNCYNTGTVTLNSTGTGTYYVGGIVGSGSPTNCFNLGKVTGTGSGTINVDGITGNGTATNCYYGGDCTLVGYSETLATDAKNQDWIEKNLYWDFACVWAIDAEINDGYPYLDPLDWWLSDSTYYDTTWEGKGTQKEPFLISTAQELAGLSYLVYSGTAKEEHINGNYYFSGVYFKQTADIDLSEHYWQPIGIFDDRNGTTTQHYFSGTYDGDGFTVSGIKTPAGSRDAYSYQGLFGYIVAESATNKAEIKNVGVINSNIQGYQYIGGIVGYAPYSSNVIITNCYNEGSVTGSGGDVGGIVGYASSSSTITNCYNTGSVTGSGYNVGGIVGYADYYSTITNCYNTGSVTGSNDVGGIAGSASNTMITNCYNTGVVSGSSDVGGIAGDLNGGAIISCYNIGVIEGFLESNNIGGILGFANSTNVYECINLGEISVDQNNGIIGGIVASGTSTNSYFGGNCKLDGYTLNLDVLAKDKTWYESNVPSWDFDLIWTFDNSENGYPILNFSKSRIGSWINSQYIDTNWEGEGTKQNPFLISTAQELAGLSYMVYTEGLLLREMAHMIVIIFQGCMMVEVILFQEFIA